MILTPEQIDVAWMADLLKRTGHLSQQELASIELSTIGEGAGMMSALARMQLSYDRPGPAPETLVIKSPAVIETNRQVAVTFRTYEREARFFLELNDRCQAQTPEILFCDVDAEQNFLIIMEDLAGQRLGDQIAGADLADTRICVAELARLHASFWNKVDDLPWVPGIANSHHADIMVQGLEAGWPVSLEVFGDVMPQPVQDMIEPFKAALPRLQEHLYTAPRTLLHGDFRLENLFFGGKGQAPLTVFDWQGPLQGRGIDEVAFFLAQNTQTDVRQEHEQTLVKDYVDELARLGVSDYGMDTAWADYRLAVLYNWCVGARFASNQDESVRMGFITNTPADFDRVTPWILSAFELRALAMPHSKSCGWY